ncbi:IstB-like ATP binding protein, partial [Bradyrhizobium shewense]
MLTHPTLHLLTQLGLTGMAEAFKSLADNEEVHGLAHAEWLALLLDHEATWRNNRRLALRLRKAKLRHHAVPEDIDYRAPRGLDRRLFDMLLKGDWIK